MLGKHVIDRDQDLVGNGNYGPLIAATCLETEKLVSQISAFGSGRRIGGLHQSALQVHIATGDAAALALAGGFVSCWSFSCNDSKRRKKTWRF
jgi:hypothetical protein